MTATAPDAALLGADARQRRGAVGAGVLLGWWLAIRVLADYPGAGLWRRPAEALARGLGLGAATSPDGAAAATLALGCLVAAMLVVVLRERWRGLQPGPAGALAAALAALVGATLGQVVVNPPHGWRWPPLLAIWQVGGAALAVVLWIDAPTARGLLRWVLVLLGLQAALAVGYWLVDYRQFHSAVFLRRTSGGYSSPNELKTVLLPALALGPCLAQQATRRWQRVAGWSIALAAALGLLLTFSRSGWLAVLPLGGCLLARWPGAASRRRWRWAGFVAGSTLVLLATLLVRTHGQLPLGDNDRSSLGRLAIWEVAWDCFRDRPLVGHGLGCYGAAQRERLTPLLAGFRPGNTEAKSLLLTVAAEQGLLGLLPLLAVAVAFWRLPLPAAAWWWESLAIRAALLGVVADGLFDTPILDPRRTGANALVAVLIALAVPLAGASDRPPPAARPSRVWRWPARPELAAGALLLLPAAWLTWQSARAEATLATLPEAVAALRTRPGWTPYEQLPPLLIDALVAAEDRHFWVHRGVDWPALRAAARHNVQVRRLAVGGSTITMQVARYVWLGRQKTVRRKVDEIVLAGALEARLPKPQILEIYANSARFGLGAETIGTAAERFFGCQPAALTPVQQCFLAGVLPEPVRNWAQVDAAYVRRALGRVLPRLSAASLTSASAPQAPDLWLAPLRFERPPVRPEGQP
ncbi:MAG: transglycosylase domain-containing protein [Fimbriimonadaceae bacterium]|nr:transglycosylase domain-containing protein [Fimbriimonadaceae bacterium]